MQARTQEQQDQTEKRENEERQRELREASRLAAKRYFDVHEYHRMEEAGVFEGERVELIDGEVARMNPIGSRHFNCVNRLNRRLVKSVGDDVIVSPQNPVRLDEKNQPEPDLAVIKMRDYRESLPAPDDILLIVEVSDTTLAYDRNVKLPLYAKFGIPEVWIVDLTASIIERYSEPSPDGYRLIRRFGKEDTVESAVVAGISFPATEVLG